MALCNMICAAWASLRSRAHVICKHTIESNRFTLLIQAVKLQQCFYVSHPFPGTVCLCAIDKVNVVPKSRSLLFPLQKGPRTCQNLPPKNNFVLMVAGSSGPTCHIQIRNQHGGSLQPVWEITAITMRVGNHFQQTVDNESHWLSLVWLYSTFQTENTPWQRVLFTHLCIIFVIKMHLDGRKCNPVMNSQLENHSLA